jgi:hypothetical protein
MPLLPEVRLPGAASEVLAEAEVAVEEAPLVVTCGTRQHPTTTTTTTTATTTTIFQAMA